MELLGEFYEREADLAPNGEIRYKLRKAVRALVFDSDREMAVMYVAKHGYHKLPGGGVEKDESLVVALERGVREETGCRIVVRPESLGAIIEYRDSHELLQISYCFLADLVGKPGPANLTAEEKEAGFELEWMRLPDAVATLEKDVPLDYVGIFVRRRDLLFLETAAARIARAT